MMKWLVGSLAVATCGLAVGCSGPTSREGKIVQVVGIYPLKHAPPEALQKVEEQIRAIPSSAPVMEQFEWGRTNDDGPGASHCLLVTFKDAQFARDRAYLEALGVVRGNEEEFGPYFHIPANEYLFHDATPRVRTATHRHLRRVVLVGLAPNTTREQRQKFEEAIVALPAKISAIERLEWGTRLNQSRFYCLLFTFNDADARDQCLAHPAYKEFQSFLDQLVDKLRDTSGESEYIAHSEYVPAS